MRTFGLYEKVQYLKGVGPKKAKLLKKLGIETVWDLLNHKPREWYWTKEEKQIKDLREGDTALVSARVERIYCAESSRRPNNVKVRGLDSYGMTVSFFNIRNIYELVQEFEDYYFYGKVTMYKGKPQMVNPIVREATASIDDLFGSVYPATAGLESHEIKNLIRKAYEACKDENNCFPSGFLVGHTFYPMDGNLSMTELKESNVNTAHSFVQCLRCSLRISG